MDAIINELNPEQRDAVETLDGPVLVVAGAGSGKTRVITARILHLLQNQVSPYQILAMTFTNKAALEMKTRVAATLGQGVKDLTVTTFHSFCARFLRKEMGYLDRESNFAIFDTQDQTAVLKRVIRNLDLTEKNYPAAQFRNRFSYLKNKGDGNFTLEAGIEEMIYKGYEKAMKEQNALDFDDLMLLTVKILENHTDCRERYQQRFRYVMVDEYQDTNKIQARLIDLMLNEDRNLCVVGDEDQSIYGWRGADIRNILDFELFYPGAKVIKLEQNYRSSQNILDYANQVIAYNQMRKPKKLWTSADQGSPIFIRDEWSSMNEAEKIIQEITRLARSEERSYSDFAILFRSNYLSRGVEDMCRRYQVPYQLIGGLKFYDRKEIKDILAYMRVVVNSRDWVSFIRAIGVPPRSVGIKSQDKLFQLHEDGYTIPELVEKAIETKLIPKKGLNGLTEFLTLYKKLKKQENELKPSMWLKFLIEELDYRTYLAKIDDATVENRVANVDELIESMRELENQGVTTLAQFMDFSALISDQDNYDKDEPKVSLMTIHAAKGLEFDCVFVMGLEDGVFPNARSINENPNALEEERRLFYVAVTRARERLVLSYARRRQSFGSTTNNPKSRFLIAPAAPLDEPVKPKKTLADFGSQVDRMKEQLKARNVDVDFSGIAAPKAKTGGFKTGDTVKHKTFGIGTVSAVRGSGERQTVSVFFQEVGKKTLVAKIAKLEKLN